MIPRNFNSFQTVDPSVNRHTLFSGLRRTAAIMAPVRLGNRPLAEAPALLALSQDRATLRARAAAEAKAKAKTKAKAKAKASFVERWRQTDEAARERRRRRAMVQRILLWVLVREALFAHNLPAPIVARIVVFWRP